MRLDADAISRLYEAHAGAMLGFFMRRTYDPEATVDLVAETFVVEWLLSELRARLSPSAQPEPAPGPLFEPVALQWLERQTHHLLPVFGSSALREITIEQVDAYRLQKVREGRLCAATINKTIATLAAILDSALEYGLIDRNPAKGSRRRLAAPAPARTILEHADQITALLDAATTLDQTTGTRPCTRPRTSCREHGAGYGRGATATAWAVPTRPGAESAVTRTRT